MRTILWSWAACCLVLGATQAAESQEAKDPPARPKRAKLLAALDLQGHWQSVRWTPDGKHLLATVDREIHLFDSAKIGDQKPGIIAKMRSSWVWVVGFSRDGNDLVTYADTQGSINAVAKIQYWRIDQVAKSGAISQKPHREVELEANDIRPLGLGPDGKTLIGVRILDRPMGQANQQSHAMSIQRLDASTGDTLDEITRLEDVSTYYRQPAFSPSGEWMYVQFQGDEKTILQCRDTKTGKTIWEREMDGPGTRDRPSRLIASPDGATLAAEQLIAAPVVAQNPPPVAKGKGQFGGAGNRRVELRNIPVLYNAKTGQSGIGLALDLGQSGMVLAFSHDGQYAAGEVWGESYRNRQLVVWTTKNGNVVKRWATQNSAEVAFHPSRLQLAVLETRYTYLNDKTTRHEATLGLWDLAPLQK